MKSGIHPNWKHDAQVICSCGQSFTTGSIQDQIQVDICSNCHPFFTGEVRFVDIQGRVERFKNKQQAATDSPKLSKKLKKQQKAAQESAGPQKSLKDLLQEEKTRLEKTDH